MIKELSYKEARLLAGLKAEQVAKKLHISLATLSAYENYKKYPKVNQYFKFCEIVGYGTIRYKKVEKGIYL